MSSPPSPPLGTGGGYSHSTNDSLFARPLEHRDVARLTNELDWLRAIGPHRAALDRAGRAITQFSRMLQNPICIEALNSLNRLSAVEVAVALRALTDIEDVLHSRLTHARECLTQALAVTESTNANPKPSPAGPSQCSVPDMSANPFNALLSGISGSGASH